MQSAFRWQLPLCTTSIKNILCLLARKSLYFFRKFPLIGFPNEFAARQFASAGFLVLQADDGARGSALNGSEGGGPCAAHSYEAAAKQLIADGLMILVSLVLADRARM